MRNKKYYLYILIFGLLVNFVGFDKPSLAEDLSTDLSSKALATGEALAKGENKPKFRWEYKYQEGDRLFYRTKKKFYRPRFEFKGLTAGEKKLEAEVIFELLIKEGGIDNKVKIECGDNNISRKKYDFLENSGRYTVERNGNVRGMNAQPIFLLSQPQFSESGLDIWNKEIKLFKGDPTLIIGYYRVLEHESILKGRRCVVIETEIGQIEDGTDAEKGIYDVIGAGRGRIKIKAKTWFDPKDGKIIRMETKKDHGKVSFDVVYELLDERELRELDGIENDWELVLPGVNNFQLTKDGKIVFTRVEEVGGEVTSHKSQVTSEEEEKESPKDEPRTTDNGSRKTSFIYICNGDGSNQRRLTEGTNPVVSPDGKMVAYGKNGNELWVVSAGGQTDKRIAVNSLGGANWSLDSRKIAFGINEENNKKLAIFEFGENEIKKLNFLAGISWLPDNNYFLYQSFKPHHIFKRAFEPDKHFIYDLKENKSKEIEGFPIIPSTDSGHFFGTFSPNQPIYLVFNDFYIPFIIYFSSDYKILKTETIENEGALGLFKWKDDGNILFLGGGPQKFLLYSVSKQKILWKKEF